MSKYDSFLYFHSDKFTTDWYDALGKMKPGAHAVAICPVLEHHRITQRVEDSGFEIRDSILFLGEPKLIVTLARVPLEGTVAQNVLKHGVGALNIDKCRIGFTSEKERERHSQEWDRNWKSRIIHYWDDQIGNHPGPKMEKGSGPKLAEGRWPANCILSKCPSIIEKFPTSIGARSQNNNSSVNIYQGQSFNKSETRLDGFREWYNDSGSAARFFHQVEGDIVDGLVKYLVKLINPPGGKVLFLGSTRYDEHQ